MNTQLLLDGLKAMILGMGMVYFFLIVMIWIMHLTAKLLKPYSGLLEKTPAVSRPKATSAKATYSDQELAETAIAAVRMYRSGNFANETQLFQVPVRGKAIRVSVSQGMELKNHEVQTQSQPHDEDGNLLPIKSPLPGTIVKIGIAEGDRIDAGDTLAVIEAMKMETDLKAESSGIVRKILVSVKDVVAAEDPIFLIEATK